MGFTSMDDLIAEITTQGKYWRSDFMKIFTGGTVVAGRWYDLRYFDGYPARTIAPGNYAFNGDFMAGIQGWTLGSANWTWTAATHVLARAANADVSTVSQNTACTNGVTYSVTYTITAYTAGGVTVSLGGTAGTLRSSAATFKENIVCGATANAPLVFTPNATANLSIDVVSVIRELAFFPYTDTTVDEVLWHGGNVSTDTKHAVNIGAWVQAAAGAPSVLQIVDTLGVYPRIRTDLNTLQNLNNTLTIPRYTDGKGVRPYFAINTANGANAQNFSMTYTNTVPTSGRSLGATVANTASAIVSHLGHSGVAGGNFGPFLPLMGGDQGVQSVQSCQFSAASASAGFVDLFLVRPLYTIPLTTAFIAAERNLLTQLPSLPRVQDGAVLSFLVFAGAVIASGTQYQGYIDHAWG